MGCYDHAFRGAHRKYEIAQNYTPYNLLFYITLISLQNAQFITKDTELLTDLINLSNKIFPESDKERHQEALVRKTWEEQVTNTKRSINGNFRIWIYYCNKEGESHNVEVSLLMKN